ncbi:MAG: polysaccharide deacetylase family protein [Gemmatimonadaceae bacterium]
MSPNHMMELLPSMLIPAISLLFAALVPGGTPHPGVDSLRVPILVYHNIQPSDEASRIRHAELTMTPEVFASEMQYLKDHGIAVVSLGALVDALNGKGTIPQPAVVITFDDGRVNQYEHAFPVLKRFGYTATFFPFTHAIGRNPRYFTWPQLLEMQKAGMTIGSHSNLHVRVDRIHDAATWQLEIKGSRDVLREHLGTPVDFFSYPFGALAVAGDSAVRAAGYRAARAFSGGTWNRASDNWRLHAVPMTGEYSQFQRTVEPPSAASVASRPAAQKPAQHPARRHQRAKG